MTSSRRYYIGINNAYIGIYDLFHDTLLPSIKIPPLTYKKSSKIYRERVKNGMVVPAGQQSITNYVRQVFHELFTHLKLKQRQIAKIVICFNECDSPVNRIYLANHLKENGIRNVSMIEWKSALCMELLVKTKFKASEGECFVVMILFEDFYQLIVVKKTQSHWLPVYYKVFANDFSPNGFQEIKTQLSSFNYGTFIIYHFCEKFYKMKVNHIFERGLAPANVHFFKRKDDRDKECLNGTIFKARAMENDSIAKEYEVVELFWCNLRINCDNKLFFEFNTYMSQLPITVTKNIESEHLIKELTLQYNCNTQKKEWKTIQIFPSPIYANEISVTISVDTNGAVSFAIDPPILGEGTSGDIYARFIRPKIIKPELSPPPHPEYIPLKEVKGSGGRLRGRASQKHQQYRPKRARRGGQTVFYEDTPIRPKIKKARENVEERRKLRAVARQMRKWQEKKFLYE